MKIVFFGTPDFALPSLKLLNECESVTAVVTSPPKPTGRGLKEQKSPVQLFAESKGIGVLTPANPNVSEFAAQLAGLAPDLYVVVSYGFILSGDLLRIPKYGGINLHPSLLPKCRGAAPIQWTLIRGETITGITIIHMNEKMDAGNIILQKEFSVQEDDTYDRLSQRLAELGPTVLLEAVQLVKSQNYQIIAQDQALVTKAPKIKKEDCRINWQQPTNQVYNFIRGLSSDPAARTGFRGQELKIIEVERMSEPVPPGTVKVLGKKLLIGTQDGSLSILKLQPPNKKVQTGTDFINGFRPVENEVVS